MSIPTEVVTAYGLPGAVILALVGTLLWVVRLMATGRLVPSRYYDEVRASRDAYKESSDEYRDQVRDLTTVGDLALHFLAATKDAATDKGGDDA